jgi:hypothetical protein
VVVLTRPVEQAVAPVVGPDPADAEHANHPLRPERARCQRMRAAPRRTAGEAPLGPQMVEDGSDVSGDGGDTSVGVTRQASRTGAAVAANTQLGSAVR